MLVSFERARAETEEPDEQHFFLSAFLPGQTTTLLTFSNPTTSSSPFPHHNIASLIDTALSRSSSTIIFRESNRTYILRGQATQYVGKDVVLFRNAFLAFGQDWWTESKRRSGATRSSRSRSVQQHKWRRCKRAPSLHSRHIRGWLPQPRTSTPRSIRG